MKYNNAGFDRMEREAAMLLALEVQATTMQRLFMGRYSLRVGWTAESGLPRCLRKSVLRIRAFGKFM